MMLVCLSQVTCGTREKNERRCKQRNAILVRRLFTVYAYSLLAYAHDLTFPTILSSRGGPTRSREP